MTDQRGVGDNGGPALEKFTAKRKLDRIREVLEMDITAAQKCVGVGIIVEADTDGVAAEISTKKLQLFASVADRETVYRATKILESWEVAKPIKVKGKANSYRIIPEKVMDAIVEAYNEVIGSRVEPDIHSPVKPDGIEVGHPVGLEPACRVEPVGLEPTGQESFPPNPLSKKTHITQPTAAADSVSSSSELDCLNGSAVEITEFIASHNGITFPEAERMLVSDVRAFTADVVLAAYAKTRAEMAAPSSKMTKAYKYMIGAAVGMKSSNARDSAEEGRKKILRMFDTSKERARR